MPNDEAEILLKEISQLILQQRPAGSIGTLLYAKCDKNFVSLAVFEDRKDGILYREPHLQRLGDLLLDLWEVTDSPRPWAEIEYLIRGDQADVSFNYPDQIDPDEMSLDRRGRIVAKHFGNKPILYPPQLSFLQKPNV